MAKFRFNLQDVEFDLKGREGDLFGNEKINFDLKGKLGKIEIEAEASIEEMIKEVIPQIKDVLKASIENKKRD